MPPKKTQERPPQALPKNLVMSLSYCPQCKMAIGVGGLPSAGGHATKDGGYHEGMLLEIDAAERISPDEKPGDFLARMMKKYVLK